MWQSTFREHKPKKMTGKPAINVIDVVSLNLSNQAIEEIVLRKRNKARIKKTAPIMNRIIN